MEADLWTWQADLDRGLAPFVTALRHKTGARMCPLYVAGLIGPGDRKSVQPMAARAGRARASEVTTSGHFYDAEQFERWNIINRVLPFDALLAEAGTRSVGIQDRFCSKINAPKGKWCCQTGLNCRPLHYQWSALPLSYGSMPRIRESANRPRQGGPILATRPEGAQARERPARPSKAAMISPERPPMPSTGSVAGRSGSPFPRQAPPAP